VRISLPVTDTVRDLPRRARLSTVLTALSETTVQVYLRDGEAHNDYVRRRLPDSVAVETVPDLHAKAIVTPEFVYVGSANITRSGLHDNRELCEIVENEYESTAVFLSEELDLRW
jgi:phosphatidylserine/phosphatidylglycerophosphate/cardiolipin synthase-like enzyme